MSSIIEKLYWYRNKFIKKHYTVIAKVKAFVWGIYLDKGCSFRGRIIFYKTRNSNITIGKRCRFNSSSLFNFRGLRNPCIIQTGKSGAIIQIGNDCGFSSVSIVCDKSVLIGNNVLCGANVIIGDRNDHEDRYAKVTRPIIIDDNVWIGMNSIIMGGVRIFNNSIIGAGSLVTKDIPPYEIWGGVPARFIKKIDNL
jgi:hypothetical protein